MAEPFLSQAILNGRRDVNTVLSWVKEELAKPVWDVGGQKKGRLLLGKPLMNI